MIGLSTVLMADFTRDIEIVTDSNTGLEWQDDTIGTTVTWEAAIAQCEALTLGEHEDWRLPNINELTSLMDDTATEAPLIDEKFTNNVSNFYWSSTSHATGTVYAWCVHFGDGIQSGDGKNNFLYVRCVRAGQ